MARAPTGRRGPRPRRSAGLRVPSPRQSSFSRGRSYRPPSSSSCRTSLHVSRCKNTKNRERREGRTFCSITVSMRLSVRCVFVHSISSRRARCPKMKFGGKIRTGYQCRESNAFAAGVRVRVPVSVRGDNLIRIRIPRRNSRRCRSARQPPSSRSRSLTVTASRAAPLRATPRATPSEMQP